MHGLGGVGDFDLHFSIHPLEWHARPGVDAVARHVAERDPVRVAGCNGCPTFSVGQTDQTGP